MRKGEIVRAFVMAVALVMALTGNWGLLISSAVIYQAARVAVVGLERRGRRRHESLDATTR